MLSAYDLVPPVHLFSLPELGNSTANVGVRTGAGEFILRTYTPGSEAAAILYEHHLLQWLAGAGLSLAVPVPLLARNGESLVRAPLGWQSLAVRLPGSRLDRHNLGHIEAFGAALGGLHTALVRYPSLSRPGVEPNGALEWTVAALPGAGQLPVEPAYDALLGWWREELLQLQTWIAGPYRRLPWHVIHNDFIPNNVLVHADRVTAVLDFEFATLGARVLDLAIGLRNMLRPWENPDPWETVRHFCRGYRYFIPLSDDEVAAIPWLLRMRTAWLVAKRIERAPAVGDGPSALQMIERAWEFGGWLAGHQQRLVALAQS